MIANLPSEMRVICPPGNWHLGDPPTGWAARPVGDAGQCAVGARCTSSPLLINSVTTNLDSVTTNRFTAGRRQAAGSSNTLNGARI